MAYGQNGEMLRPGERLPAAPVVPGVQGVSWVSCAASRSGDQPWATKDEAIHYIDLMPDGKHRQYTSTQECKSVITTCRAGRCSSTRATTSRGWHGRGAAGSSASM